jgi:RNA polymerase sigma-70 factor (ECF subfamily)
MTTAVGVLAVGRNEALGALAEAVAGRRRDLAGLLESAREGDAEAFASLVRRLERPVYQLVLKMVRRGAVAEDLAQDVFIRLWRNLRDIESAEVLPAWLRRVAVNAVIDHWRKEDARRRNLAVLREHPVARRVVRRFDPSHRPECVEGPSSRMETEEGMNAVQGALARLPVKLRSVLVLRAVEGMSYEQLADTLGISTSAVRSRLFRAREEMQHLLRRAQAPEYLARMYRARRSEGVAE